MSVKGLLFQSAAIMLRTVSVCALHTGKTLTSHVSQRLVQISLPAAYNGAKSLHLSSCTLLDDREKMGKGKFRGRSATLQKQGLSIEMKQAVVNAAKSLPGDWTKTAEELITRLQQNGNPDLARELSEQQKQAAEPDVSLLKTLEIGRSFNVIKSRTERMQPTRKDKPRGGRSVESYELHQFPRLGIFDAKKLQKKDQQQLEAGESSDDLWVKMDAEHVRRALGSLPRNSFEEMIQWTKEGKLWKFPIDNEADMDEERKYKFHDHVFLERHLSEFPSKGPVRKFMELVALGLSRNSWITVPEKIEHIRWFADYFRQKQNILEDSLKEEGRMKKPEERIE